ncbi:hypothetical protein D3C85_1216650 [compost metagenome]
MQARQIQTHAGALARQAEQADVAARLLGKTVNHRQAEPGALADRLGGEERVERLGQDFGCHAGAVVADGDHQVIAGLDRLQGVDVAAVEVDVGRFNPQFPAIGHGIPGVDDQVEQGVFQLTDIGADRPDVFGQLQLEFDMVALGPAQQIFQGMDQLVGIQRPAIQRLTPGERQQAMGQRGSAVG